jgi:hypothetical protein
MLAHWSRQTFSEQQLTNRESVIEELVHSINEIELEKKQQF